MKRVKFTQMKDGTKEDYLLLGKFFIVAPAATT